VKVDGLKAELELIAKTHLGRELLKEFIPRLLMKQIEVLEFDPLEKVPEELCSGRRASGSGLPSGGFSIRKGIPTVWIERTADVEIRAAILVHEMVHALDSEYHATFPESEIRWRKFREAAEAQVRAASQRLGIAETEILGEHLHEEGRRELIKLRRASQWFDEKRLFEAERKAYRVLYHWIQEAVVVVPGYRESLERARSRGCILDQQVSDQQIIEGYGFRLVG
jgi:hypothetical protein